MELPYVETGHFTGAWEGGHVSTFPQSFQIKATTDNTWWCFCDTATQTYLSFLAVVADGALGVTAAGTAVLPTRAIRTL